MNEKDLERAEWLRKTTLDVLRKSRPSDYVHCPTCNRDEVKKFERDKQYHILAYEQMTPEQILMSEKREFEIQHSEIADYLERHEKAKEQRRKAEEQARKSKLVVG